MTVASRPAPSPVLDPEDSDLHRPSTALLGFDGLRLIAAGTVVVAHTFGLDHSNDLSITGQLVNQAGHVGVAIFFVLSGFLLYHPFAQRTLHGGRFPSWWWFVRRRLLRILPLYWLALAAGLWLFPNEQIPPATGDKLRAFGLLQIYRWGHAFDISFVAWTLCIEVAFYLALPLIAWGLRATARAAGGDPHRRFLVVSAGLAVLALTAYLWRHLVPMERLDHQHRILFPPSYLDWFAAGMWLSALAVAVRSGATLPRWIRTLSLHPLRSWLFAVGIFWVTAQGRYYAPSDVTSFQYDLRHYGMLSCAVLIIIPMATTSPTHVLHRILSAKPIAYLGSTAYGLYLWHPGWRDVVVTWAKDYSWLNAPGWRFLATFALTAITAAVTFELVEAPIQRWRNRLPLPGRGPGPTDAPASTGWDAGAEPSVAPLPTGFRPATDGAST